MKSIVGITAALSVAALVAGCSSSQTDSASTTDGESQPYRPPSPATSPCSPRRR